MKFGCLRIGAAFAALITLGLYLLWPHPTGNQDDLKAVAAEAQHLLAAHKPAEHWVRIPESRWPPAIASLKPYSVTVGSRMVDITTKPFFDGGWGYGFARNRPDLGMPPECWSDLGHGVYWHGPC